MGNLAERIMQLVGRDLPIVSDEERLRPADSEVMWLQASNARARDLLGWEPRVSLDEGLQRTIAWIRGNLGRYRPGVYEV